MLRNLELEINSKTVNTWNINNMNQIWRKSEVNQLCILQPDCQIKLGIEGY